MNNIIPQDTPQSKQCTKCLQFFPATTEYFYPSKGSAYGVTPRCKVCIIEYRRKWKQSKRKPAHVPPEGFKQCTACLKDFPATAEHFSRRKEGKGGLKSICKECYNAPRRKPPAEKDPLTEGLKQCYKCKTWLPATKEFFHGKKKNKDELYSYCKTCESADKKAYYENGGKEVILNYAREHSERIMEKKRQWNQEHKEEMQANRKRYYQEHSEALREHARNYRKTNREEMRLRYKQWRSKGREKRREYSKKYRKIRAEERKEYMKQYRQANRERIIAQRREYAKTEKRIAAMRMHNENRRARKKSVQGSHTDAQIQEQLKRQRYHCYYAACGFAKFKKHNGRYIYHIDHTFPLSRVAGTDIPANDISYLVLACPSCNLQKHNKYPHEWFEGGRLF